MYHHRAYSTILGFLLVVLAPTACSQPEETVPGLEPQSAVAPPAASPIRYNREYVFVGTNEDPLVLAPFTFRATDDGTVLHRGSRAWLARGVTWDRFLDESGTTTRLGGVWRVVPIGDLRVIAGGPAEIESFRYSRGERRLLMELDAPRSEWNQGGETRFRLLGGHLSVGAESIEGPVFEVLRVERTESDGWPASTESDAVFLTSGDSLQLMMSDGTDPNEPPFTWIRTSEDDRSWEGGEVTWLEMRPLEEARRDIPLSWNLEHDALGLSGEVAAIGQDVLLGPERAGQRAVEIRYSVAGWVDIQGNVWPVTGMIRHAQ